MENLWLTVRNYFLCGEVGSVRPLYGPVSGGTPVTITGSFFSLVHVTVVHFGQYSTRFVNSRYLSCL